MKFRVEHLRFEYGLRDVSCELPSRGLVAVAGPNGAGKSTLIGILAGLRKPYSGSARFEGREIRDWPRRDFARKVAVVAQSTRVEFPFTVEELVLMGRAPFSKGWFESTEDHAEAVRAMEITETLPFRNRDVRSLSSGERQRVILAAALAQRPEVLLLDEPATFLDVRHQFALYGILADLAKRILVVAVTHDLNPALEFSNRALVLNEGVVAAEGLPRDVLTEQLIVGVFGVHAKIHAEGPGKPWLRYEA